MFDIGVLLGLYSFGWVAVSLALYIAGGRYADAIAPAPRRAGLSVAGGAVWPLVLIGFVELSSFVVYTKVQNKPGPGVGILA